MILSKKCIAFFANNTFEDTTAKIYSQSSLSKLTSEDTEEMTTPIIKFEKTKSIAKPLNSKPMKIQRMSSMRRRVKKKSLTRKFKTSFIHSPKSPLKAFHTKMEDDLIVEANDLEEEDGVKFKVTVDKPTELSDHRTYNKSLLKAGFLERPKTSIKNEVRYYSSKTIKHYT